MGKISLPSPKVVAGAGKMAEDANTNSAARDDLSAGWVDETSTALREAGFKSKSQIALIHGVL